MKLLAVDTALGACSCAIVDDARILAHRFEIMDRGHAERLAPMVDEAMRQSGLAFADLQGLAVTTGPGTFTGQRVGLAFMRGLRVALKIPLTGITTLEAMATAAIAQTNTAYGAALHDAKRNEVYFELLHEDRTLIPSTIANFEDAMTAISEATQNAK
ncbi:MAG TPA: tRNA (adenosine(37)-N6)-threonylcarbamoyltransferase complex dimerization subunit type 1 TsaB, partial [Rhizomicrobium sp.]